MVYRAYFFVLLATFFFSSMEVALKGMVGSIGPMQVNCTRFLLGGIFLIPFALLELRKRGKVIGLKDWLSFSWLGCIGTVLSLTMFQLAVECIPANIVAVIFCCNTVFVLFFAFLFFKVPVRAIQIVALFLSCLGMLFIINPLETELPPHGLLLSVAAPVLFAVYAVLAGPFCRQFGAISVTSATFLCGSMEMLFLIVLGNTPWGSHLFGTLGLEFLCDVHMLDGYTLKNFLLMLYVSVGVSGCGFACYFHAQELASPLVASLAFFVKPVLAPLFAYILLGENVTLFMLFGIILIVIGSFLVILDQKRKRAA